MAGRRKAEGNEHPFLPDQKACKSHLTSKNLTKLKRHLCPVPGKPLLGSDMIEILKNAKPDQILNLTLLKYMWEKDHERSTRGQESLDLHFCSLAMFGSLGRFRELVVEISRKNLLPSCEISWVSPLLPTFFSELDLSQCKKVGQWITLL